MRVITGANRIDVLDERFYEIGTDYYVSVTHALDEGLYKGKQFDQWLKDTGQNAVIVSRRAAESGTIVHEVILIRGLQNKEELSYDMPIYGDYIYHGNSLTFEEWRGILRFKDFMDTYKPEILGVEEVVANHWLRYAGTQDLRCNINGQRWLLDLKFGNEVYASYYLQLASYAKAQRGIERIGVLHLKSRTRGRDKSGKTMQGEGWKIHEPQETIDELYQTFKAVMKVYRFRNPNDKPKIYSLQKTVKLWDLPKEKEESTSTSQPEN